jgi:hypothetical protein
MATDQNQLAAAIQEILTLSKVPGEASVNEEGLLVLDIPTKVSAESTEILTFLKKSDR